MANYQPVEVQTKWTVEEAVNYLAYGILRDSAAPLGWGPLVPYERGGVEIRTVTSNNNATPSVLTVPAITNAFPRGTYLIFEDNTDAITNDDEAAGSTSIAVNTTLTTDQYAGKKVAFIYQPQGAEVPNPKYIAVVDEALRQMELEDIESIDASNLREFRLRARLELLRRISEGRAYQYDYTENYGTNDPDVVEIPHSPAQVTARIIQFYLTEQGRISSALFPATAPTPVTVLGIPAESLSISSGVGIKW